MGNMFQKVQPIKLYIICDIDEILVWQTPKWCRMLYDQYKDDPIMNKYLVLDPLLYEKDIILSRGEYYLNKWLANPDIPIEDIPKEINEVILEVCNTADFYDDLKPTKMGRALQTLCNSTKVAKIYFISKGEDNLAWESKKRFMDNYFNFGDKSELIRVPLDKPKSEYINKFIPNRDKINVIIDDLPKNIFDILDNSLQDNKEVAVLCPDLGYSLLMEMQKGNFTDEQLEEYDKNFRDIQIYEALD